MNKLARALGYLATLLSLSSRLQPKPGPARLAVWGPKLIFGALSPVWALCGALGALVGLARKDWKLFGAATFGAIISMRYVAELTAPQPGTEHFLALVA